MRLAAELTCGWQDDPDAPLAAARLHREISARSGDYAELLACALRDAAPERRILGLDRLFRRRTGGSRPVRQLVGSLASLPDDADEPGTIVCEIDAFAYGFLAGAKNLDLVLPCKERNTVFWSTHEGWVRTWTALADFERVGQPLPPDCAISAEQYLSLRAIVVRPSARDERRSLATLLVSGPSARSELVADLGVSENLIRRILAALRATGVIECRAGNRYAIVPGTLPLVTFALRETMGLNPLGKLASGV